MTRTLLCKKKTPFFNGVLFRGGEGDDPFRVASLEEIVCSLVYYFSLNRFPIFTRAVERVDYQYCTFRAEEAE